MGDITHLLAKKRVRGESDLLPTRMITEFNQGEGIHVHLRNLRLEMSESEFIDFAEHITRSAEEFRRTGGELKDDGRDGFKNPYHVLDEKELCSAPDLFPHKFQIELNLPRTVHIHLRNFRIELTPREYLALGPGIVWSLIRLFFLQTKWSLKEMIPENVKKSLQSAFGSRQ